MQSLSIEAAIRSPGSTADILVHELRTVVVPEQPPAVITVVGEVADPGLISPDPVPLALSAVVASAGGPTEGADLRRVMVSRPDGTQDVCDIASVFGAASPAEGNGSQPADPLIPSRAIVTVPRRYARVTVLGAVEQPGSYTFAEGDTVVDAIALAKGLLQKGAALRNVALLRRRADGVEVTEINMRAGLDGGEDLLAGRLQDRDIVVVPHAKKSDWAKIATILFGISAVYRNVTD
jgi:protein involved in polysaccharide export with SLBB domain